MSRLDLMTERDELLASLAGLRDERERLSREHDAVTERLRAAVVALVTEHGVAERSVAKAGGIGRQSVRTWAGRDDGWPKARADSTSTDDDATD